MNLSSALYESRDYGFYQGIGFAFGSVESAEPEAYGRCAAIFTPGMTQGEVASTLRDLADAVEQGDFIWGENILTGHEINAETLGASRL